MHGWCIYAQWPTAKLLTFVSNYHNQWDVTRRDETDHFLLLSRTVRWASALPNSNVRFQLPQPMRWDESTDHFLLLSRTVRWASARSRQIVVSSIQHQPSPSVRECCLVGLVWMRFERFRKIWACNFLYFLYIYTKKLKDRALKFQIQSSLNIHPS